MLVSSAGSVRLQGEVTGCVLWHWQQLPPSLPGCGELYGIRQRYVSSPSLNLILRQPLRGITHYGAANGRW